MRRSNDITLADTHVSHFGTTPFVQSQSPGRVNLIGEHIDYSGGIVLPLAIPLMARIAVSKPDRASGIRVHASDLGESIGLDLQEYASHPPPPGHWSHYVLGPIAMILDLAPHPPAMDLSFSCEVPSGAGLSSSAAIEVAVLRAIDTLLELHLDPIEIAVRCQRAEHRFAGVPCGLMDQAASALAEPGQLLVFDCQSNSGSTINGIEGSSVVVLDSCVRHKLGESAYSERRNAAQQAFARLGKSLREIPECSDSPCLSVLSQPERDAADHAVSELQRVRDAIDAIREQAPDHLGKLLNASHKSLSETLRVSCDRVDQIVHLAQSIPGVYGARMTGGGFGGCVLALVESARREAFTAEITAQAACTHVLSHAW